MINQNERQRPKPFIDKALEHFKERNGELFLDNSGISGKGTLVIPQAVKDGYKIMFSGRQVLLMKEV